MFTDSRHLCLHGVNFRFKSRILFFELRNGVRVFGSRRDQTKGIRRIIAYEKCQSQVSSRFAKDLNELPSSSKSRVSSLVGLFTFGVVFDLKAEIVFDDDSFELLPLGSSAVLAILRAIRAVFDGIEGGHGCRLERHRLRKVVHDLRSNFPKDIEWRVLSELRLSHRKSGVYNV